MASIETPAGLKDFLEKAGLCGVPVKEMRMVPGLKALRPDMVEDLKGYFEHSENNGVASCSKAYQV